jgi:hypothetical protein
MLDAETIDPVVSRVIPTSQKYTAYVVSSEAGRWASSMPDTESWPETLARGLLALRLGCSRCDAGKEAEGQPGGEGAGEFGRSVEVDVPVHVPDQQVRIDVLGTDVVVDPTLAPLPQSPDDVE